MNTRMNYRMINTALIVLALVTGCNKQKESKQAVKTAKDSVTLRKDTSATSGDSSVTKNDSMAAGQDSTTVAKDSTQATDSTKLPPPIELTYEQTQGKYVFAKYCAVCHGTEGKADGFNTYNLDPKPHDLTDSGYLSAFPDERLIQTVTYGGVSVNKTPLMPAWGWTLKKDEIAYVVSYLRTFSPTEKSKK